MKARISGVVFFVTMLFAGALAAAGATEVEVYKSPTCGCCKNWAQHMRENGFTVKTHEVSDVAPYKIKGGVPLTLASCHTAVVDGYVIEGHVPAQDIKRLLKERPRVQGLAAPGMPASAPGMDQGGGQPYDVLSFDKAGKISVYARH